MCSDKFAEDSAENTPKGVCKTLGVKYKEKVSTSSTDDKDVVYRVIAGSYFSKDSANKLVRELKSKGYDAFLSPYEV
ncbi:MAG: SPOR domain-containing protein [Terrisporobacter sp.]